MGGSNEVYAAGRSPGVARRRGTPLTVEVIGRPGDGLTVLGHALRRCFGVRALGPHDDPAERARADLTVQVLGAAVRRGDRECAAAQRRPVIAVAGKADLRRDAARAAELAAIAAAELGRPVYPVSGLLAAAVVDDELLRVLRRWRELGVVVGPQAVAFTEVDDPAERRLRTAVLARLGARGLRLASTADLAEAEAQECGVQVCGAGDSGVRLTATLRAASGIGGLIEPIRAQASAVAAAREHRHRREAAVRAARRPDPMWVAAEVGR